MKKNAAKTTTQAIDLTLLKQLVSSLEETLTEAESKKESDENEYYITLSKAVGLASGLSMEAALLVSDIQKYSIQNQSGTDTTSSGYLDKLFSLASKKDSSN